MYTAFLEASLKMKIAAISFLAAKFMSIITALSMLIDNTATIISMSLYGFLIALAVVLSLWEGLTRKRKTYAELESEIVQLQKLLKIEQSA